MGTRHYGSGHPVWQWAPSMAQGEQEWVPSTAQAEWDWMPSIALLDDTGIQTGTAGWDWMPGMALGIQYSMAGQD